MPLERETPARLAEIQAKAIAVRAANPEVMARPSNQNAVRRKRLYAIAKGHSHVNERIRTLAHGVIGVLGLDGQKDMPVVRAWAKTEILATEIFGYVLDELDRGEVSTRLLAEWRQMHTLQLQLAKEIGMTPAARISLGLDVARGKVLSFAERMARERAALEELSAD